MNIKKTANLLLNFAIKKIAEIFGIIIFLAGLTLLMAYLIPFTFLITGFNILKTKDFFLIIENNFFTILYLISGTLFFIHYYSETYALFINGNSGFVGQYLNQTFLQSLILVNQDIFFYILILIIFIFFKIFSLFFCWCFK